MIDLVASQASHPFFAVSIEAQEILAPYAGWLGWVTNSIVVAGVVLLLILGLARRATRNMQLVPGGAQNFFELVVEFLYSQVEGIVGPKVAPRAFPLLASIFLFVLTANWFGLVPGVGTVGWATGGGHDVEVAQVVAGDPLPAPAPSGGGGDSASHAGKGEKTGFLTVTYVDVPLLRPATADLNMTLGIAFCFMLVWVWVTVGEVGVMGFLKHTFGPKGGLKGIMATFLLPIFLFVGVIEMVSIAFRPVSLSLRLFGNVFAGESLLHTMMTLGESFGAVGSFIASVVFPLPFYFLELLVGVLQAVVFSLLCAVYIQLSTAHEEHEEH